MKKTKIIPFLLVIVLVSIIFIPVQADVVSTDEFGTFSYWVNKNDGYLIAYTAISNNTSSNTIYVSAEMVDAVTGNSLDSSGDGSQLEGCVDCSVFKPSNVDRTVTYTCHEARGQSSIVRYRATNL